MTILKKVVFQRVLKISGLSLAIPSTPFAIYSLTSFLVLIVQTITLRLFLWASSTFFVWTNLYKGMRYWALSFQFHTPLRHDDRPLKTFPFFLIAIFRTSTLPASSLALQSHPTLSPAERPP